MRKRLDYYRFLGLSRDARPEEVERRCQELLDWLGSDAIPRDLRPWAKEQAALVDQFYRSFASQEQVEPEAAELTVVSEETAPPQAGWRRLWGPVGLAILGVLVGLVVVGGVFWWRGNRGGEAQPAATAPTPQEFLAAHQGRLAQLQAIVAGEPTNAAALFELGETYIELGFAYLQTWGPHPGLVEQWQKGIDWFSRLLQLDPATVPPEIDLAHAQLDMGIAYMNLERFDRAEPILSDLAAKQPQNPQVHYVLGFLYASSPTPNMERAAQHWGEVVRVAPDSQWAAMAKTHLEGLELGAPSPSP